MGFWQLGRLEEKEQTIADRHALVGSTPVPVTQILQIPAAQRAAKEYTPVSLTGRFLYDKEVHVGPRSAPVSFKKKYPMGGTTTGSYVFTPFRTKEGALLLVNRGWIPRQLAQLGPLEPPAESAKAGDVTIAALYRQPETQGPHTPDNVAGKEQWFFVDPKAIATARGLEGGMDVLVDLMGKDDQAVPGRGGGYPVAKIEEDYVDFYVSPDTHKIYAGTWFSLGVAGIALTFFRFRP